MESSLSLRHWNIQWDLRNFRDFEWLFIHNKPMVIMVILNPLTIDGFLPQPCQTGSRTSALVVWSCQSPSLAAILTFDNWSWWQTSPHQTRLIKDPGVNWHRYGNSTSCRSCSICSHFVAGCMIRNTYFKYIELYINDKCKNHPKIVINPSLSSKSWMLLIIKHGNWKSLK